MKHKLYACVGTGLMSVLQFSAADHAFAQNASGMWCYDGSSQFNPWKPCSLNALTLPSATFTRPADTTAYQIGDLVANNTTVALVAPMAFTLTQANSGGGVFIRRAKLQVSSASVTAPNFRLHLFTTSPTAGVGDNSAFASTSIGWFCDVDINLYTTDPFSDSNAGIGVPNSGAECAIFPTTTPPVIYGLLEARGAYAPTSAETFSVTLEVY